MACAWCGALAAHSSMCSGCLSRRYAVCRVVGRRVMPTLTPCLRCLNPCWEVAPCTQCMYQWCVYGQWQWPWSQCHCREEVIALCKRKPVLYYVVFCGWVPCCCLRRPRRRPGDLSPESCPEVRASARAWTEAWRDRCLSWRGHEHTPWHHCGLPTSPRAVSCCVMPMNHVCLTGVRSSPTPVSRLHFLQVLPQRAASCWAGG